MARVAFVTACLAMLFVPSLDAAELLSRELLPCGKEGAAGGLAAGSDLTRVTIDVHRYPKALCNDGTPAVFYVRPASRPEDATRWHISLQGGGGCGDGQSCAERWCSVDTNFGMDKMTTSLTKPSVRARGILAPDPVNPFGTWNTVLVYYCSSDQWSGRAGLVETSATLPSQTLEYAIRFQGADIIDAVIGTLRGEDVRRRPARRSPTAPRLLADLDTATEVLLSGSSAGGNGIIQNGDRIVAELRENNIRCGPSGCPLKIGLLADSAFEASLEFIDFSDSVPCSANPELCTYEGFFRARYEAVDIAFRQSEPEASCREYHSQVLPGTEWQCGDGAHIARNHITTPLFIGMDLQDSLISSNQIENGFATASSFGARVEEQLRDLENRDATAEEGSAHTGKPLDPAGSFGPQCGGHELIGNDREFRNTKIADGGELLSYQDVVWNWWTGAQPQNVVVDFRAPGPLPDCP